jgi:dephospho-CoA kinase
MDNLIELLKEMGFRRVSMDGVSKQRFMNDDFSLSVIVEENLEKLTAQEEELIKKRLKELGYLC